jgi:hypothetical protein
MIRGVGEKEDQGRQGGGQKIRDQEALPYEIRPGQHRPKAVA